MKDVDPLAATLRRLCELSSNVATNRKVAIGHQPGKGERTVHAAAPETQDAITMLPTKRRSLVSRDIRLGMGIPIVLFNYAQPCVSPPTIRAKKAAMAVSKLPLNMSVTPLRDERPREVASLAMAHQTLRSIVSLPPLFLRRPGSPYPFFLSP